MNQVLARMKSDFNQISLHPERYEIRRLAGELQNKLGNVLVQGKKGVDVAQARALQKAERETTTAEKTSRALSFELKVRVFNVVLIIFYT